MKGGGDCQKKNKERGMWTSREPRRTVFEEQDLPVVEPKPLGVGVVWPNMPPPVLLVAPKPPEGLDPKPARFSVSEWSNALSRSRFNVPVEGVGVLVPKPPPNPLDCCWLLFEPKPPPNPPNDMMGVRISRCREEVYDARSCPQTMLGYGKDVLRKDEKTRDGAIKLGYE